MKILFICGSAEPGSDGVGDYTRILAQAVSKYGVDVFILAVWDRYVFEIKIEKIESDNSQISLVRMPARMGVKKGFQKSRVHIESFAPDWISLQYVPYAYNAQGVPWSLSRSLAHIAKGAFIHLMIHEGFIDGKLSFKNKLVRLGQIEVLKKIVRLKKLKLIHTSNVEYKTIFQDIGIQSFILGLFGNIPIKGERGLSRSLLKTSLKAVYFGASPKRENFESIAIKIAAFLDDSEYRLELVFCGKAGKDRQAFIRILNIECGSEKLQISDLGMLEADELSEIFLNVDFGIARVGPQFLGKSGTVISMLEHGLPLFVPLARDNDHISAFLDFRAEQCFSNLEDLIPFIHQFSSESRISEISDQFLKALKTC
jgi:hypothetical protein